MNIADYVRRSAVLHPGKVAWIYGECSATYLEFVDRVRAAAGRLAEIGLESGDRVVIDMPNRPEQIEFLFGAMWGGFTAVPVNWHLHPDEVSYIVEHCGAKAVVASEATERVQVAVSEAHPHVVTVDVDEPCAVRGSNDAPRFPMPVELRQDSPAWLFYTSGTTGRPKGATLTHRNLQAMALAYWSMIDTVDDNSTYLHAAPMSHGSGLYLVPLVGHGATNVISSSSRFDPYAILDLIERHKITHAAFLAPTMLNRLVDAVESGSSATSLRSIMVGGAPLYATDLSRAMAAFGPIISQMYGQGEAPMTIAALPAREMALNLLTSCGRPFDNVEVTVVDAERRPVPTGEHGEICVRGDVVMVGYWGDLESTASVLSEGWLRTGDIGHFDGRGYLHLTDRLKDVIITGGSNVYPREVEEALLTCDLVREAAVVGRPDPVWGEAVVAYVVPTTTTTRIDIEGIHEHLRSRIANFKQPKDIHVVDGLPKNATGKVLKRTLQDVRICTD